MDCVICHDGEDCEVNGTCPNCFRILPDVEFQGEFYKHFNTIEEAEGYRDILHEDDCMDNLRFCWQPFWFGADEFREISDEEYDEFSNKFYDYLEQKEQGCCGFMDENIFIGNQMAKIGCNYGH